VEEAGKKLRFKILTADTQKTKIFSAIIRSGLNDGDTMYHPRFFDGWGRDIGGGFFLRLRGVDFMAKNISPQSLRWIFRRRHFLDSAK
jgi:hypothetical protein